MMVVLTISGVILSSFFLIQVLSLAWMIYPRSSDRARFEELPKVSLLLAARNEEKLILRSLRSIEALNYPKDKLQVLIGNDQSTDKTSELIEEFIEGKPNFELLQINSNLGKGRGKANVLAHLAHKAEGEYFFITDVDVKLPSNWITGLLKQFTSGVGIVSGTSMCERGAPFATMQSIDWLHFMGYIKAFASVGIGCTTVGNNMAVKAEAYWQTGGFEAMDFSITEDYRLFKEVTQRGWKWGNSLDSDTLGLAWYIPSLKETLHQRKRWLIGARELPLNWKSMIILYGLFIPALLMVGYYNLQLALWLWFIKLSIQTVFIWVLCLRAGERPFKYMQFLLYELYVIFLTVATAVFYFLPIKSVWKGREYNKAYLRE